MAWTELDYQTLKRAIASGAKKIKYSNDKEVEYRDLADMEKTLRDMEKELFPKKTTRIAHLEYNR